MDKLEEWREKRGEWLEEIHESHEWHKDYLKEANQMCPFRTRMS